MTGYREHGFDPNAYEQPGKPLKPYNWVQWTGVGIGSIGIILSTLQIVARLGWTPDWFGTPSPSAFMLMIIGVALINSRREPGTLITDEQRDRNRKVLIVTVAICAAILGAALAIEFGR